MCRCQSTGFRQCPFAGCGDTTAPVTSLRGQSFAARRPLVAMQGTRGLPEAAGTSSTPIAFSSGHKDSAMRRFLSRLFVVLVRDSDAPEPSIPKNASGRRVMWVGVRADLSVAGMDAQRKAALLHASPLNRTIHIGCIGSKPSSRSIEPNLDLFQ